MKLVQSFLTKNPCYMAGRKLTVKGLMLHSVGCSQPRASVFISNWNKTSYGRACVHAFIDGNDGTVYQTLPWNHRGWHCGGSGNNTHIGVEMCEPGCIKYTSGSTFTCSDKAAAQAVAKRTYDAAVELFAMLCKKYGLNPLTNICSHKEGCAKGIASNHGDPEHLWTQLGTGYTMDGFRKAVKAAMDGLPAVDAPAADSGEMTDAEMFAFFKAQGFTDAGAAGLMGNLDAESCLSAINLQNNGNTRLSMTDVEYTAAVDSGAYTNFVKDGYGYGLAQWTYWSRKQQLLDFTKAAGVSVGHKKKQCEFIIRELAGYPSVLQTLRTAKTVREASDAVMLKYECPANQSEANQAARANRGQSFFNKYAGSGSGLPFKVKVSVPDLNIRTGAGTNFARTGQYTGEGIFTITEIKPGVGSASGWGKLKSGAGWVSLDYCSKI